MNSQVVAAAQVQAQQAQQAQNQQNSVNLGAQQLPAGTQGVNCSSSSAIPATESSSSAATTAVQVAAANLAAAMRMSQQSHQLNAGNPLQSSPNQNNQR